MRFRRVVNYDIRGLGTAGRLFGWSGSLVSPQQAEDIITSGQADAVFLGRELLRNPYWAQHAALALDAEPTWPDQYAYVVKGRKR